MRSGLPKCVLDRCSDTALVTCSKEATFAILPLQTAWRHYYEEEMVRNCQEKLDFISYFCIHLIHFLSPFSYYGAASK